jgi:single-stranded DNA-binding protein
MYTLNQLTIIGFTGNDAEAHYTPNGTLVVTLSVATKNWPIFSVPRGNRILVQQSALPAELQSELGSW